MSQTYWYWNYELFESKTNCVQVQMYFSNVKQSYKCQRLECVSMQSAMRILAAFHFLLLTIRSDQLVWIIQCMSRRPEINNLKPRPDLLDLFQLLTQIQYEKKTCRPQKKDFPCSCFNVRVWVCSFYMLPICSPQNTVKKQAIF